ncbi:MAG: site-specific integrase [Dehalococcoidia bacterium]|nr:site-specific integrase [Dehalococcoidia bacterium]MSQ35339.1 site-specific integrase [Dehalococcoidia bacterium]
MPKRRGHGEGSISERADGRWMARYRDTAGRRTTIYGQTRAEVAGKLVDSLKQIRDGVYAPSNGRTVDSFAAQWIETLKQSVRPKTLSSYSWALKGHILPSLGKLRLTEVRPAHVQALYAACAAKGLAPKSVRNVHLVLHAMLQRAFVWGVLVQNPVARVDAPRVERKDPPMLTSAQVRSLLDAARGHPMEALVTLAVTTGARSGEMLGLRWNKVDFEAGTMEIRVALSRVGGVYELVEPKTARSRRSVAVPVVALEALRRHRARQTEQALKLGPAWQNGMNLVFTSEVGTPVDHNNFLRRDFRPLLKKAGLPIELTFHDCRHIAASFALSRGVPIPLVSEMLGHSDPATTLRVYAHAIPLSQRQFADAMDAAVAG